MVAKQTKNEGSTCPDWGGRSEDEAIEHVRSSGEGDPAAQQLLPDIFGKHEDDTPAPVPSGGEADGEGDYPPAGDVIEAEKAENERLRAALAARPVLSREALREAVLAGLRAGRRDDFSAASVADAVVDHLANVLAGGEQA